MLTKSWKNYGEVLYLDCQGMRRQIDPQKKLKVPFSLHWVAHEGSEASLSRQIYPHFRRKLRGFRLISTTFFSRHLICLNSFTCFLIFLYRILLFLGTQPLFFPEMLSRHVTPLAAADKLRSPLMGSHSECLSHSHKNWTCCLWTSSECLIKCGLNAKFPLITQRRYKTTDLSFTRCKF